MQIMEKIELQKREDQPGLLVFLGCAFVLVFLGGEGSWKNIPTIEFETNN